MPFTYPPVVDAYKRDGVCLDLCEEWTEGIEALLPPETTQMETAQILTYFAAREAAMDLSSSLDDVAEAASSAILLARRRALIALFIAVLDEEIVAWPYYEQTETLAPLLARMRALRW